MYKYIEFCFEIKKKLFGYVCEVWVYIKFSYAFGYGREGVVWPKSRMVKRNFRRKLIWIGIWSNFGLVPEIVFNHVRTSIHDILHILIALSTVRVSFKNKTKSLHLLIGRLLKELVIMVRPVAKGRPLRRSEKIG